VKGDPHSAERKARFCFALAASTTFPDERETAIQRGLAILAKAGLNPDDFVIPGRDNRHAARAARAQAEFYATTMRGRSWSDVAAEFDLDALLRTAMAEALRRRMNREGPSPADPDQRSGHRCPHGVNWQQMTCYACESEAAMRAGVKCRHGRDRVLCKTCVELDGTPDELAGRADLLE
jgi:hypothetical protein